MHCNFDAIFLPKMFRELTAAIQKGIEEARKSSAESAAKLLDLLAIPAGERSFAQLGSAHRIAPGSKLPAPAPVFPRYVEPEAGTQKQ